MANKLQKFIYNVSFTIPIFFSFAFVWYQQNKTIKVPIICMAVLIVLIVTLNTSFYYGKQHVALQKINVKSITPMNGWLVPYIIAYIIPFASIVLDDFNLTICAIIALVLVFIAPFYNSAMPNLLLCIKGYHFYSIDSETGVENYVLISKRRLRNTKDVTSVKRIFEYLLLDVERS